MSNLKSMLNNKFCGNCEYLSLTEQQQSIAKRKGEKYPIHVCNKYGKQVFHKGNHPNIVRLVCCEEGRLIVE